MTSAKTDEKLQGLIIDDTNSARFEEIDPVPANEVAEKVASETITATDTDYVYINMNTFRRHAFTIAANVGAGSSLVFTVEGTSMNDDVPGNLDYTDVTNTAYGVANYTPTPGGGAESTLLLDGDGKLSACTWIRVKYAYTHSASTTFEVHIKKVY
jgi:hypothetical protein